MAPSGALPSTKAQMFPLIQSGLIQYLTHGYQPPTYALYFSSRAMHYSLRKCKENKQKTKQMEVCKSGKTSEKKESEFKKTWIHPCSGPLILHLSFVEIRSVVFM